MSAESRTHLEAFRTPGGHVVRLVGRGTMRESRVFHDFACHYLASLPLPVPAGEAPALTLDLSECRRLDSTFLGCLVDLHKRFNRDGRTLFALGASAEVRRELLGACRLDRILPSRDAAPAPSAESTALVGDTTVEPQVLGKHVMECHRRLAEEDCPDRKAFAQVADNLERELSEKR